ncbi:hypothetical protein CRG98_021731 [Punica granatum]|uniref:Uncharacterized protein n=1 Tax=Punica granatum TaxID=22663 RepID=A0A2I0JNN9_PUNGR|nr:hypothetical protein CRG98_021731 [Punica granatum]
MSSFNAMIKASKKVSLGIKLGRIDHLVKKGEGEPSKKTIATAASSHNRKGRDANADPRLRESSAGSTGPCPEDPERQQRPGQASTSVSTSSYSPVTHIPSTPARKITLEALNPNFNPANLDQSLCCEYHMGAPGHTTDNCYIIRVKLQAMIDKKLLLFNEEKPPNVQANPILDHQSRSGSSIHMISICPATKGEAEEESAPFVIDYAMQLQDPFLRRPCLSSRPLLESSFRTKEYCGITRLMWRYYIQVLEILNAFSILLGKPWIHSASAVPSSLHQKVKFFVKDNLITVNGEEDYAICKGTTIPYISIGDDQNLPFHSFEIISIVRNYEEVGPTRVNRMIEKVLLRNNYLPEIGLEAQE